MYRYIVCDNEGNATWPSDDDAEAPEGFAEYAQAETRAKELSAENPTAPYGVYAIVAEISCEISQPQITTIKLES